MILLDLPIPRSVNNYRWKNGGRKPHVLKWHDQAGKEILAQRKSQSIEDWRDKDPVPYAVYAKINSDANVDIDNVLKSLLDLLQNTGTTPDDRNCDHLCIRRDPEQAKGRISVLIAIDSHQKQKEAQPAQTDRASSQ